MKRHGVLALTCMLATSVLGSVKVVVVVVDELAVDGRDRVDAVGGRDDAVLGLMRTLPEFCTAHTSVTCLTLCRESPLSQYLCHRAYAYKSRQTVYNPFV